LPTSDDIIELLSQPQLISGALTRIPTGNRLASFVHHLFVTRYTSSDTRTESLHIESSRGRSQLGVARMKLKSPLKNLSIYGSKGLIVIYGYDDVTGLYQVLEINRPILTTDGPIRMKQLPQQLTLNQVIARKKYMKTSYKDMELFYENVHCIYGCIKLLDSHYLLLVTKKSKIGSILGHSIYSIDEIAFLPVTFGMKSSADEARYRSLLGTFEFTKYLYFSYTYDLTKSYQLQTTTKQESLLNPLQIVSSSPSSAPKSSAPASTPESGAASHRSLSQHMFVWNSFAMKPFLRGGVDHQPLDHWCTPVIYGYINQRHIQLQAHISLQFLLIARRSRLFAGTRYLRRGVDILGHVANEVETEQLFYLSSSSSSPGHLPRVTSLIQCRGSIPLFWSHTNLYSPKPDVQLESDLELRLAASKKHFENLFIRYGFNIHCLNLVKQLDSKGEMMLGSAYQETCESLNQTFIEMKNSYLKQQHRQTATSTNTTPTNTKGSGDVRDEITPLTYISYDFLTMAKYQHIAESEGVRNGPNVFRDINKICEGIYGKIGFYVDPPPTSPPSSSDMFLTFPIVSLSIAQQEEETSVDSGRGGQGDGGAGNIPRKFLQDESSNSSDLSDLFYELLAGDSPTHILHSDEFLASLNPTNTLGTGSPTGLLQNGVLRTNCMDCLDRTNVAQFCYAKLNIMKQLKAIGLNLLSGALQEVINICMEVWAEHGDAIAIQYGGSGAMHKVDKQDPSPASQQLSGNMSGSSSSSSSSSALQSTPDQEFCLTGGSKNALVAVQRYYSNISTDYDRQQAIDLLLGIYEPKKNTVPIWEERLRTQHLRFGARGRRQSDLTAAGQHDLNLLLQLDNVTKKEKIKSELLMLQQQQQQPQQGESGAVALNDGDFLVLHDEDREDEEEEGTEDEEEETEEDEIWEDTPVEQNQKQRKSVRIPLPGYQVLDSATKPFFHISSMALDSITEFRDIVEESDIETVNCHEVSLHVFSLTHICRSLPIPSLPSSSMTRCGLLIARRKRGHLPLLNQRVCRPLPSLHSLLRSSCIRTIFVETSPSLPLSTTATAIVSAHVSL
jgi:hypothetical protein